MSFPTLSAHCEHGKPLAGRAICCTMGCAAVVLSQVPMSSRLQVELVAERKMWHLACPCPVQPDYFMNRCLVDMQAKCGELDVDCTQGFSQYGHKECRHVNRHDEYVH